MGDTLDVYGAGAVLYQTFSGGKFPSEQGIPESPPPYADEALGRIILKACAKSPTHRWTTPQEMGMALLEYAQNAQFGTFEIPGSFY